MKRNVKLLLMVLLSFFLYQCDKKENYNGRFSNVKTEENADISAKNKQTWENARALSFSDTDFLKTKQPMSDDAIAPYDYHTGLVGDKAYNQIVYIKAFYRVGKHLSEKDNQLIVTLKSGAEVNIAEDLFEYILAVVDLWNEWIKESKYEIVKTNEGYYDIAPITSGEFEKYE